MSDIVQLYSDKTKTTKAYPKTLASETYMGNGGTVESEFDKVIANVTNGNESITNSEIVQARGEEINLNARLNKFDSQLEQNMTKVNEQFNTITNEQYKYKKSNKSNKKLYVTLMDDDGRVEILTKLKPILDEFGLKMSFAINCGLIGRSGYLTWEEIKQLKTEGHEILNHTIGSDGTTIQQKTIEQLENDYLIEKENFLNNGLDTYDYLVYSGVMPWQDTETKNKISKFYKCCFANTDAPYNYLPFDNFAIHRGSLTYRAIETVDRYLDMGYGYLVLFQHSWMLGDTELQTIREVLSYLKSKDVIFITAKEMIDNFSNTVNLGNVGDDKFLLDENGNVDFSIDGKNIRTLTNVFFSDVGFSGKPISEYRKNSITVEKLGGTYATYWLPEAGIIKTYRFDDDRFAYQEYTKIGSCELWKRVWNDTKSQWDYFSPVSGVSVSTLNRPKFIKRGIMIHDYTINKMIFAQNDGFGVSYTQVTRSTSYSEGSYINTSTETGATNNRLYKCIVAGITSDTAPTYSTVKDSITVDGTAQFIYIGDKVVYRDATGQLVT